MSENANIRKEVGGYGLNLDNFKVDKELTVEITLNEYRALVSQRASHSDEIRKKTEELSKVGRELRDAKERIEGLLFPENSSDDE